MRLSVIIVIVFILFEAATQTCQATQTTTDLPNFFDWRKPFRRTVGTVVPWPKEIKFPRGRDYLVIEPVKFLVNTSKQVGWCEIVERATNRYMKNSLFFDDRKQEDKDIVPEVRKQLGSLTQLGIDESVAGEFKCESIPHDEMDESYSLSIAITKGKSPIALLKAPSSWGLIRGLETFSQLVFNLGPNSFGIRPVAIEDSPRFKFRGYMLDTARHYISKSKILDLIEAMAVNKMNVFHWHIVDDQSFPLESSSYPDIAKQASFRPNMIYSHSDVQHVVTFAADRGIRVIPELDTPGHSYALRFIPNMLTPCYDTTTKKPNGDFGPINPIKMGVYQTLAKLFREILTRAFTDQYFHAGGDEVDLKCWQSNPDINAWLEKRHMSGKYDELNKYFIKKIYDLIKFNNRTMMVWQEVFDTGVNLPKDAIIHVWKDAGNKEKYAAEIKRVVGAGYRTLLSSCWYLNYIDYGQDWVKYYQCDPTSGLSEDKEKSLVLGGEACMWTEFVDDSNVIARTWPRASAAAERLWSSKTTNNTQEFFCRLEQLRCRMSYRGIQAEPVNGPGYC